MPMDYSLGYEGSDACDAPGDVVLQIVEDRCEGRLGLVEDFQRDISPLVVVVDDEVGELVGS